MLSARPLPALPFQRFDEDDWRTAVAAALAGQSADTLAAATDDGIAIAPIARAATATAPLARPGGKAWRAVQPIEDPEPARARGQIGEEIAGGAGGLTLVGAASAAALRTGFGVDDNVLRGLRAMPKLPYLRLELGETTYCLGKELADTSETLALACDPLAEAAARGGFDRAGEAIAADLVDCILAFESREQNGLAFVADGRVWAAGGASEAQELAGMLGSLAHAARLLAAAGLAPEMVARRLGASLDAGPNQLVTLAKMRAARLLQSRFLELLGVPGAATALHAETSWRAMTRHDPYGNILRATAATLAAGVGGADTIAVLPFTAAIGLPDSLARRIARNLQTILIEESGLARVGDPAAGSGAIEALTAALAERAWTLFRDIETRGGLLDALRAGSFQREIAAMRDERAKKIARREIAITGVSDFPVLEERKVVVLAPRPRSSAAPIRAYALAPVLPVRLSEPFETLRDRADALAARGGRPRVFVAGLGTTKAMREADEAARNFFAAGGIQTLSGDVFGSADDMARALRGLGLRAACVAGDAEALARDGAAVVAALKQAGAVRVHARGVRGPAASFDAIIDRGCDAVATLGDLLDALERA